MSDAADTPAISIRGLVKRYPSGFRVLDGIDLDIRRGEIFALLGPNGAGKTTLISAVCGLVRPTEGTMLAEGRDVVRHYRTARRDIGLVPQELATDSFETVRDTVSFSRGLFGRRPDPALIERLLRDLSLWDKRDSRILALSGGMKRRVMIAKALSHEPRILFLDEPTAGVDVELRRDMWALVRRLRESGVTIILTTHYIEEAEEMADRIGVMNRGRILLVEEKDRLMRSLGKTVLTIELDRPVAAIPEALAPWRLERERDGAVLRYTAGSGGKGAAGDGAAPPDGVGGLLRAIADCGLVIRDLRTTETSLEDIFVGLVHAA